MSGQPPWSRPPGEGGGGEPTAPRPTPSPQPQQPAPPAPPEVQLPPPAPAAPGGGGGGGNRWLIIGGVAAFAAAIAVVLVIVLGGGEEEPAPPGPTPVVEDATPTAEPSAQPTATPPEPTATPGIETSASVSDLIPQQAGPWRFAGREKGEVLLEEEGAFEAYLVDYRGGPGGTLNHQVGVLESSEQAQALLAERIAERRRLGDRIPDPEPYVRDGMEIGSITYLTSKHLTVAFWTNRNLYCTALAGTREGVEAFLDAMPY